MSVLLRRTTRFVRVIPSTMNALIYFANDQSTISDPAARAS